MIKNSNLKYFRIDVAILGARMHYAVPEIFQKHNLLHKMYTDLYIGNKPLVEKLLKLFNRSNTIRTILSRKSNTLDPNTIVSFDRLGIAYALERKRSKNYKTTIQAHLKTNIKFNELIISKMNMRERYNIVYAFNTAALELFEYTQKKEGLCILEQTIAPKIIENKILTTEIEKYGSIDQSLEIDEHHPMIYREQREWILADLIIVPSKFVYDAVIEAGAKEEKCRIVPYGVNKAAYTFMDKTKDKPAKTFNVLFAGHVGIRKGIHYLLQASNMLKCKNVKIKLAGNITLEQSFIEKHGKNVEFLGRVPRQEMQKLYEWADLFVFPSLCEGSATVIYEAMISGVPVVTSPNAGSIITHGVDGMIIKPQDIQEIADTIDELAKNTVLYNSLVKGLHRTRLKASLETYENNLINTINQFINENT